MSSRRVVIAGAGISGLATAFRLQQRAGAVGLPLEVTVLEEEPRPGGKIGAEREDGFVCERGPNGFLDSREPALRLARDLGLEAELLRSDDASRKRFVYARGSLHQLPDSPIAFFRSQLMTLKGRLRVAAEVLVPPRRDGADESLADFARRRLGVEAYQMLLDPMVTGIFAGDPEKMSIRSAFPRIKEMEETYGGLIRAMFRLMWERRQARRRGEQTAAGGSPSGPAGKLTAFRSGLEHLTDTLASMIEGRLFLSRPALLVERSDRDDARFLVRTDDGDLRADAVVLATPAPAAAGMIQSWLPELSELLGGISYVPAVVVGLGFPAQGLGHDLDGFGYLIPKTERRRILGTLWTSSIFPGHRAADGSVLLRTIVGGARNPEVAGLGDSELLEVVRSELSEIMGIRAKPSFVRIIRWPQAIPQYAVGHGARLAQIDERLANAPGLFLTGNAYRGVALPDCCLDAERIADRVVEHLASTS